MRRYKKLPAVVRLSAEEKEALFREDWKNPLLAAHKLKGRLSGLWAFSITNTHRIIFERIDENTVFFETIGDHSIYD